MMFGASPRSSGPLARKLEGLQRRDSLRLAADRDAREAEEFARAERASMRRAKLDRLLCRLRPNLEAVRPPVTEENQFAIARDIIAETAVSAGITVMDMRSQSHRREVVESRHRAMFLIAEATTFSLPRIGRLFGHKDHTTVLHGVCVHAARNGITPPRGLSSSQHYIKAAKRFATKAQQGRAG